MADKTREDRYKINSWDIQIDFVETDGLVNPLNPVITNKTRTRDGGRTEMWGEDLSFYHKRVKRGDLLPHTNFEQHFIKREQFGGILDFERASDGKFYRTEFPTTSTQDSGGAWSLSISDAQARIPSNGELSSLVAKTAAKIYGQGHDTLTFLMELHKLRGLVFGAAQRMRDLMYRKSPKQLASLWLEGRYGWRILYYDIVAIDEAIREFDEKRTRYSDRVRYSLGEDVDVETFNGSHTYTYHTITKTTTWETSLTGSVMADIRPPRARFDTSITAWELMPYSFVFDWFVDVGSWLEGLQFLSAATRYEASYGYKIHGTREWVKVNTSPRNNYSGSLFCRSLSTVTLTQRIPTTVPNHPLVKVNLDAFKISDLLALVIQNVNWEKRTRKGRRYFRRRGRKLASRLKRELLTFS